MADIDLKAATPDTTLPSTGFLFGADSQSAASPSVYSTQTVATALLGSTSLTGATVTTSSPLVSLAQTWNASGTTFEAFVVDVTRTAAGNNSTSFAIKNAGANVLSVYPVYPAVYLNNSYAMYFTDAAGPNIGGNRRITMSAANSAGTGGILLGSDTPFGWANSSDGPGGSRDLFLGRRAAASLRLGAADAATAVAQTLGVQSVTGVADTAGANFTIAGSQGTGTGAGGSIVFQVAPAGTAGSAQNALSTALTIASTRVATFASDVVAGSSSSIYDGSNFAIMGSARGDGGLNVYSSGQISFCDASSARTGTVDVILRRDAANTLALRNGANAQAFRVYNTTDGTNLERGFMRWSSNVLQIGTEKAGTGTARNLELQTDGVTRLILGTNTTIRGLYIFLRDSGGADRVAMVPKDGGLLWWNNGGTAGIYQEMEEMTAPAAPDANRVRIYAEDDGAGKTRLMARFATGAAVQIAIEP